MRDNLFQNFAMLEKVKMMSTMVYGLIHNEALAEQIELVSIYLGGP